MGKGFAEVGYDISEGTDEHDTPIEFFEPLARAVDGFDLDPCASEHSQLAETNLTKAEDGLREWWGKVYMNPPYSAVNEWMNHAKIQNQYGKTDLIVALVYARTSTQWFHNHASTADYLCFIEGRLQFAGNDQTAPAPSMLVIWSNEGPINDELARFCEKRGLLFETNMAQRHLVA